MTRVVLDTNVLAPGFTSGFGASAQLLDLWKGGVFELVVSEHLLAELERAFRALLRQASSQRGSGTLRVALENGRDTYPTCRHGQRDRHPTQR